MWDTSSCLLRVALSLVESECTWVGEDETVKRFIVG